MVLVPYNTDAPLYHFPFATIGLIVVNTIVFAITVQASGPEVIPWTLQFGKGLHPLQWVSTNFLHAGIMHLVGNMFFLWGFGLVVEGKLGWWRFLILYLVIGAIYGALVQTAMLGSVGLAVGASGAIFGLMAIALIWAPKNEMSCFLWFFRPVLFEAPITVFATTFLVWQVISAFITSFSISSAMLHLTGAGVGAVFGVALLKLGWVDCEGWDLLSVRKGEFGGRPVLLSPKKKSASPPPLPLDPEQAQFLTKALGNRLHGGDAAGAVQFYKKQRGLHTEWRVNEADLLALIQAVHNRELWSESVLPMIDYLRQFPANAVRVRLKLAQILIETEHRPGKALKVLAKIAPADLPADLQSAYEQLTARATQDREASEFELVDDDDV